jgi:hypothetical protein
MSCFLLYYEVCTCEQEVLNVETYVGQWKVEPNIHNLHCNLLYSDNESILRIETVHNSTSAYGFYPSTHLPIYGLQRVDLRRFFSFLIDTQSVGLLGRGISPSQGRYLHTEQHKHRINSHRHPWVEWDSNSRFPVFELAKTVHDSDLAATVIGIRFLCFENRKFRFSTLHNTADLLLTYLLEWMNECVGAGLHGPCTATSVVCCASPL